MPTRTDLAPGALRHGAQGSGGEGAPLETVLSGLVYRLAEDARRRLQLRRPVEERWLEDLRQYEGRDDDGVIAERAAAGQSTATINVTRPKCNTFESKLYDMLFPTDDRNWGIEPTPVPEMGRQESELSGSVEQLQGQANVEADDEAAEQLRAQADELAGMLREMETTRERAQLKADVMADEIEDNLVETEYAQHCRDVIHDATVAGTGVLKGPIPLSERVRMSWLREDGGHWRLKHKSGAEDRFAFQHVSYWHLFPDTSARSFHQVQSWMERHLMTHRDLQEFAKLPGVDKEAVRDLLMEGPQDTLPDYLLEVDALVTREGQASYSDTTQKHFVMWEYRGPLETEEMQATIGWMLEQGLGDGAEVEIDPLLQADAVIWFCQNRALKFAVSVLDSNEPIYSVFQCEKSTVRLWSVGIPYLMRSQQEVIYDAWRRMLDNAAFGAFPLTEIDTSVLQPTDDGQLRIYPGAVFERTANSDRPGIIQHPVQVNQEHYSAIIQLAMQFLDSETNISVLAQGEQGASSRTAGGMALLMNSVNVVFRRVVKNFDDGITSPTISRAYHFLMQYSQKDELKGDYTVQARGSSVLLVREVQAQNLLLLASQISLHPLLGRHFKVRMLLKRLLQSMMLSADDILKTQSEVEAEEQAEAQAAAEQPDPEMVKMQLEREVAQMDAQTKTQIAQLNLEGALMKLVAQRQMSQEQAQARLAQVQAQSASRERIFAGEAALEARKPAGVKGSGGYL